MENRRGEGQDVAVDGEDLSLADDLEVAELLALQQLPNVVRHCGRHQLFSVGDESSAARRRGPGRSFTLTNQSCNKTQQQKSPQELHTYH